MTLKDYIDEVILRALRYNIDVKSNTGLIATQINRARHEVTRQYLNILPDNFAQIGKIQAGTGIKVTLKNNYIITEYKLPENLVSLYNVIGVSLKDGLTYRFPARLMTSQEAFGTFNTWNKPSKSAPAYFLKTTFDQAVDTNINNPGVVAQASDYSQYLCISYGDLDPAVEGIDLEIWYTAIIDDLEYWNGANLNDTEILPIFMEEVVILYALLYVLEILNEGAYFEIVKADIKFLSDLVLKNFETNIANRTSNLISKEGV